MAALAPSPGTRCRACPYAGRGVERPQLRLLQGLGGPHAGQRLQVTVHETGNNAVRARLGLPQKLGSCHTALVGGYVVEGHVPASDVRALLQQSPRPWASPCPACPWARRHGRRRVWRPPRPYDVLLVAHDGSTVFSRATTKGFHMTSLPKSPPAVVCAVCRSPAHQRPAFAQAPAADSHAAHHTAAANAQQADLSEGEVTRVDAAALKVTLRHGELKNLNMPPMTMVFRVQDAASSRRSRRATRCAFGQSRSRALTTPRASKRPSEWPQREGAGRSGPP